ncbi:MAG TPA: division/cell wall cluster transcriptional repressor MraZ [Elusimicrobia bacterium]|nr:MAG: division/cell wall cluster transcriptional repressor MraZ [Elusimicrobia bacterium RIFOXYA12_FULL_49_49]OGS09992.1 MAG: division/cell wall cluster transcriptional repressor MraZ [Elusimicrobia bacterium RIFOXYA1_FULL_47_7]OGS11771.1 MAG: division/cell wall cluster transcriptional repressor MraZ [Elusimicrobia bacterium RIFOXYB1_FULL_48_9]OGS15609.1 MAG: division/cell wall cluster transcriptional repressor MraZ [Elusimicrobia bacterium RIFOXYA2_FULL_47_53]OGS26836.1 MAG: division/cell wa
MKNKLLYLGQYLHSVDKKNRLFLPSKFRSKKSKYIVSKGLEGCLYLYDSEGWDKVILKLENLSLPDKKEERAFKRALFSGAGEVECDSQGRILLPQALVSYAAIKSQATIIGVGNRLEIWDSARWEKYQKENAEVSLKNMASKMEI